MKEHNAKEQNRQLAESLRAFEENDGFPGEDDPQHPLTVGLYALVAASLEPDARDAMLEKLDRVKGIANLRAEVEKTAELLGVPEHDAAEYLRVQGYRPEM